MRFKPGRVLGGHARISVRTLVGAVLVVAVGSAGCASPTWIKGTATYEEAVHDELECEREADARILGSTPEARSRRKEFAHRCMTGRGYEERNH